MNELLDDVWYHIPEFNGYLIDNTGSVKSEKFPHAYPEGVLIQYNHKDGEYYVLSNERNKRIRRTKQQLLKATEESDTIYPQNINTYYMGGRNKGYMNYGKHYPNDRGTVKINILGEPSIITSKKEDTYQKEIKLQFQSLQKFMEKQSEQMVTFY